ncbi:unnamed protein product [Parnassius apollo]|uniref:(apollo) hypothetical protein n=1 Tax=Parnassius apollo TaxID=110799 RepID=A0A8S3XK96_PARAO|nr:unnamed protein product [Parnassius apollo]
MSEVCFICDKPLKESEIVLVDRGMKTLIDASVERNDKFFEYLKDKQSVIVHERCRKMYTRKSSIVAAKRQRETEQGSTSTISPPHTRARVSEPDFNLRNCLFCGDEANEEAEKKIPQNFRRKIYNVSTLEFKDSILKVARTRSDDVAKAVIDRILIRPNTHNLT